MPSNGSLLCAHMFQIRASPARRDYCGYYSNVSRDKRKKQDKDGVTPSILEPDGSSKEHRKNWARLIQKIGACPRHDPGRWIP